MKRPKKRFFTLQHILDEIDRYKQKRIRLMEQAMKIDCDADALKVQGPRYAEDLAYKRIQAKKLRESAMNILNKKIPYLKEKMAEFQTPQLPGVDNGDKSIQG